jgi:hypothetical protein
VTILAQIAPLRHIVMGKALTNQVAFRYMRMNEILLGDRAHRTF